jgi:hypothetical protein
LQKENGIQKLIKTSVTKTTVTILIFFFFTGCNTQSKNWIILFDGKNVKGLRGYKMENFPWDNWKVEEGTLKTLVHEKKEELWKSEKLDKLAQALTKAQAEIKGAKSQSTNPFFNSS